MEMKRNGSVQLVVAKDIYIYRTNYLRFIDSAYLLNIVEVHTTISYYLVFCCLQQRLPQEYKRDPQVPQYDMPKSRGFLICCELFVLFCRTQPRWLDDDGS